MLAMAFAVLMTMALPAIGADVNEKSWADADCGEGYIGTYHFVLNKYDSAGQVLTVKFGDGAKETTSAYKTTRGVQHFSVQGAGGIVSADTTGGGWLVLSDYECEHDKKGK